MKGISQTLVELPCGGLQRPLQRGKIQLARAAYFCPGPVAARKAPCTDWNASGERSMAIPCMRPGRDQDRSAREAAGLQNTSPVVMRLSRGPVALPNA